ncbi:acyl-[acyl-carrier-protein] thioesterase [Ruficoccus amylovorans]|uniref:Acyl-[acyl-carrier-protein] thioesterase n=1 Tax=Ruficoccus amylovorans TaxID=1804625 RepID=A0A842HGW5_9BACT|nr:acyl-ACP thioesterase domain-containing protein [Ruficoccus amylovorans]MBC2594804.1 acyl-[acyl-carrier-protein] thioesterase [Ruficoccus amylovorans]
MHTNVGSYPFHIASYMCDFQGRAPLPLLGSLILHAASRHAHERGFGYDHISRDKIAWVLSRLAIEWTDYPGRDEALTIETWVGEVARFYTQRCFRFVNAEGRAIGHARSVWAALDMCSRRPVNISEWRPDLAAYACGEIECPVARPARIPAAEAGDVSREYTVGYSDIDINGHLNSVKYIEHTLDVFDLAVFRENVIRRFEITYLAEGHFGEALALRRQPVSENEYIVETLRGEESLCRSRISWERVR